MLRKLLIGVAALGGLGFASSAHAVVFQLDQFTGTAATAEIEVIDIGATLQFTATVTSPDFADIRGVFFNVASGIDIGDLTVSGTNVTDSGDPDASGNPHDAGVLAGDANLNGGGVDFDFGVEIGTAGIGSDDINPTVFTVGYTSPLDIASFFEAINGKVVGLRITSVGSTASSREGSSKLAGGFPPDGNEPPPTDVPEPGMLLLFGTGLLALGLARRIRAA